jgi:hypothetical protein
MLEAIVGGIVVAVLWSIMVLAPRWTRDDQETPPSSTSRLEVGGLSKREKADAAALKTTPASVYRGPFRELVRGEIDGEETGHSLCNAVR